MASLPRVDWLETFRKRLPVGTQVYHAKFGLGITTTEMTGDGYVWVKFDRTYKTQYKRTVREIHYKRLEITNAAHSSN
jgi:hypothetical protein